MSARAFAAFWPAVQADVVRNHGRFSLWLLLRSALLQRPFRPVLTLRLCQAAAAAPGLIRPVALCLCRVLHRWAQAQAGLDLPWTTHIGPAFCIDHGWGLVITHGATIGANVTVFHGVTIGRKDDVTLTGRRVTYPTIEDEVWIGPHAVIIGQVTVGHGSRVAAGAIVTRDVEPYSIVGGNPAKVIQTNALPDVFFPARLN